MNILAEYLFLKTRKEFMYSCILHVWWLHVVCITSVSCIMLDRCMHHTHDGCTNMPTVQLCVLLCLKFHTQHNHTLWSTDIVLQSNHEMCCDMHISVDHGSSTAVLYPWGKSDNLFVHLKFFVTFLSVRMPNMSSACCSMVSRIIENDYNIDRTQTVLFTHWYQRVCYTFFCKPLGKSLKGVPAINWVRPW